MESKADDQPDGKNDPGKPDCGLKLPDVPADIGAESKRLEEIHETRGGLEHRAAIP